jgi:hypothetical protein
MYLKIEEHLQIIARYDEVLCEKAPKHSLEEIRSEVETQLKEMVWLRDKSEVLIKNTE